MQYVQRKIEFEWVRVRNNKFVIVSEGEHQRALRTPQKKGSTAAMPLKIHTSDKPTADTPKSCVHKEKERVSSFSAERGPSEAPTDDVSETEAARNPRRRGSAALMQ